MYNPPVELIQVDVIWIVVNTRVAVHLCIYVSAVFEIKERLPIHKLRGLADKDIN